MALTQEGFAFFGDQRLVQLGTKIPSSETCFRAVSSSPGRITSAMVTPGPAALQQEALELTVFAWTLMSEFSPRSGPCCVGSTRVRRALWPVLETRPFRVRQQLPLLGLSHLFFHQQRPRCDWMKCGWFGALC